MKRTLIILNVFALAGCSGDWKGGEIAPFSLGVVSSDSNRTKAIVEVVEPTSSTMLKLKPGQKIRCKVRLRRQEDGRLPTFLNVKFFRQKGGDASTFAIEPAEKTADYYECARTVTAPKAKGIYYLNNRIYIYYYIIAGK